MNRPTNHRCEIDPELPNGQLADTKYLERYANVYTLVRGIPGDRRFRMDVWGGKDGMSECGTAACMAGHAGLHPWFRRRGFVLEPFYEREFDEFFLGPRRNPNRVTADAATEFFGFSYMGGHPFDPETYAQEPTPKQAAATLKRYMLACWPKADVDAAIAAASATYDPGYVHRNANWSKAVVL